MIEDDGLLGLAVLTVPLVGAVQARGDPFEPYRLADPAGEAVSPVTVFLADLQACGRAAATQRSYSMALLRWFRFLWAVEVRWDQATRVEARDFVRWVQVAGKPCTASKSVAWRLTCGLRDPLRGPVVLVDHPAEYLPPLDRQVQRNADLVVLVGWSL